MSGWEGGSERVVRVGMCNCVGIYYFFFFDDDDDDD